MNPYIFITDTVPAFIEAISVLLIYSVLFGERKFILRNPIHSALFSLLYVIIAYWATFYITPGYHTVVISLSLITLTGYFTKANFAASLTVVFITFFIISSVELTAISVFLLVAKQPASILLSGTNKIIFALSSKAAELALIFAIPWYRLKLNRFKVFKREGIFVSYYLFQVVLLGSLFFWINKTLTQNRIEPFYYVLAGVVFLIILVVGILDYRDKLSVILKHTKLESDNVKLMQLTGELSRLNEQMKSEISARIENEVKIHRLAYYDSLTGLPNRSFLLERLDSQMQHWLDNNKHFALIFVNIDNFKNYNDMYGHQFGDLMISELAIRLKHHADDDETLIIRHGGDEFVILLDTDSRNVQDFINDLSTLWHTLCHIKGYDIYITASIGVALFPEDGTKSDILLKNADMALHKAKAAGRNNYKFFNEDFYREMLERTNMEHNLRRALEQNEFMIYYQPQVCMRTGQLCGVEALLRWKSPEGVFIPPSEFIPIAEKSGLMIPIGKFVLLEACRQNKRWQEAGLGAFTVSVNISAIELQQESFKHNVMEALKQSGLSPAFLEIEITESIIMPDFEMNVRVLSELREMGVKISLDDFGTGYSSLSYLSRLPINTVKIDKSFIDGIIAESAKKEITSSIIELSHKMGLKVTAEGVETKEQNASLFSMNCDLIQGYYTGMPMPETSIHKWFEEKGLARRTPEIPQIKRLYV